MSVDFGKNTVTDKPIHRKRIAAEQIGLHRFRMKFGIIFGNRIIENGF